MNPNIIWCIGLLILSIIAHGIIFPTQLIESVVPILSESTLESMNNMLSATIN